MASEPNKQEPKVGDAARSEGDAAPARTAAESERDDHAGPAGPGRRRVLSALAVCAGATVCAGAAVPGVGLMLESGAGGSTGARWIRTIKLDQLADGQRRKVPIIADARDAWTLARDVQLGTVWIERRGSAVRAWSTVCPHLGCSIESTAEGFSCPCHASNFSPDGERLTGPVRRAMDTLDARIDDGWIMIDFRRFRIGAPEKVVVG